MSPPSPNKPRIAGAGWLLVIVGVILFAIVFVAPIFLPAPVPKDIDRVSEANPALQAAVRQAQAGLPGFIAELSHPKPDESFAIDGRFKTPTEPEYLWVKHVEYHDGSFHGILDQVPVSYSGAKKGDPVTVARADVFDWAIRDPSGIRGMFTEKALRKQSR